MTYTIRIPTVQFGYLETEFEGTAEEAFEEHAKLLNIYNGGFGLTSNEFNKALDQYLSDGTVNTEQYLMSKEQQMVIQEIKKSMARIKSKNK